MFCHQRNGSLRSPRHVYAQGSRSCPNLEEKRRMISGLRSNMWGHNLRIFPARRLQTRRELCVPEKYCFSLRCSTVASIQFTLSYFSNSLRSSTLNEFDQWIEGRDTAAICLRCVSSYRTYIDHSIAELNEGTTERIISQPHCILVNLFSPFYRNIHVCDIVENEIYEGLVSLLADKFDKILRG